MNFFTELNITDMVLIAVVLISTLVSAKRGFAKEAVSLGVWVAAFFVATVFNQGMQLLLADLIAQAAVRQGAAFLLLFILTLVVGSMVSYLIGEFVKMTGLTTADRVLGMAFGFVRGIVVVVVMAVVIKLTLQSVDSQPGWYADSAVIPQLLMLENWSRDSTSELLSWLASGLKG
mgnify:CR=1 FL=1